MAAVATRWQQSPPDGSSRHQMAAVATRWQPPTQEKQQRNPKCSKTDIDVEINIAGINNRRCRCSSFHCFMNYCSAHHADDGQQCNPENKAYIISAFRKYKMSLVVHMQMQWYVAIISKPQYVQALALCIVFHLSFVFWAKGDNVFAIFITCYK